MAEQFRAQEHHFPFHYSARQRELNELYASSALRNFAAGLMFIFEPIYVYLDVFGRSLPHTFFFFGLSFLVTAFLAPFAGRALAYLGIKHSMLASTPFALAYFAGLWAAPLLGPLVMALPLILAVHNMLYWPAFHADFTRFSNKRDRAKQASYAFIIISVVSAAAPVLGGFIVQEAGFSALFGLVMALFFLSLLPLFLSREVHSRPAASYSASIRGVLRPELRPKAIAFISEGADAVLMRYVWPLFLFLLAISFEQLGLITSAVLAIGIAVTFAIGRITDRHGATTMLRVGASISAIFWPLRAFVSTPFTAFLMDVTHQFGRSMSLIPFTGTFYNWAGEVSQEREHKILSRSIALNGGAGVVMIFFAALTTFTSDLRILFWFGPLAALGLMFISESPLSFLRRGLYLRKTKTRIS